MSTNNFVPLANSNSYLASSGLLNTESPQSLMNAVVTNDTTLNTSLSSDAGITPEYSTQQTNNGNGFVNSGSVNFSSTNSDVQDVGIPSYVTNADSLTGASELSVLQNSLVAIDMLPMQAKFDPNGLMLYTLEQPNGSGASNNSNASIPPKLRIWTPPYELNISETFGNSMIESIFQNWVKPVQKIGEIAQIFNDRDVGGQLTSLIGKATMGVANAATAALKKHGGNLAQLGTDITGGINTVLGGQRFMFPKLWADSSATISYSIPIYLQCDNTSDNDLYTSTIINPLKWLLQYTLPITYSGSIYSWPWFVYVESPGLFIIPEGVVTSLTVDKRSDTLSFSNRPSIIKVDLTITSIRETMPQDNYLNGNTPAVPLNMDTYLATLQSTKFSPITIYTGNISSTTGTSTASSANTQLPSTSTGTSTVSSTELNAMMQTADQHQQVLNYINAATAEYPNVPPCLMYGIISTESSFNPGATAYAADGTPAQGLTQCQPGTFQQYCPSQYSSAGPYNPQASVYAGTAYISSLLTQHNGDVNAVLNQYSGGGGSAYANRVLSYANSCSQNNLLNKPE